MPMDWGLARDYAAMDVHLEETRVTEAQWLACTDPDPVLQCLPGNAKQIRRLRAGPGGAKSLLKRLCKASDRKLRLFACACCRRLWDRMRLKQSRSMVEATEAYVDGLLTDRQREAIVSPAADAFFAAQSGDSGVDSTFDADNAAFNASAYGRMYQEKGHRGPRWFEQTGQYTADLVADIASRAAGRRVDAARIAEEKAAQCDLMRDIFGSPFRPVVADRSWLTPSAVSLAEGIYADRSFDRLPLLADALEDAGCTDAELLAHLRGPGPHVRGCWAVDLVLGKS
jgi:hypothetical protein